LSRFEALHTMRKLLVARAVDDEVVEDRARLVAATPCRAPCRHGEARDVVRDEVVDDLGGVLARHLELAHVRHVEEARGGAHGHVLVDDPAYCTGISHPANGTIRPPSRTWAS
jgi:hypothetical protein